MQDARLVPFVTVRTVPHGHFPHPAWISLRNEHRTYGSGPRYSMNGIAYAEKRDAHVTRGADSFASRGSAATIARSSLALASFYAGHVVDACHVLYLTA